MMDIKTNKWWNEYISIKFDDIYKYGINDNKRNFKNDNSYYGSFFLVEKNKFTIGLQNIYEQIKNLEQKTL